MKNAIKYPHLLKAAILNDLPEDDCFAFLDECSVRFCAQTTPLIRQDEYTNGMFLVAHGIVEVGHISEEGHNAIIYHAGPGEVIGMMEAIAGRPCAANCTAFENATVLFCPTPLLFERLKSPVFVRNIAAITCDLMMRDNTFKTIDNFYSAEQRICSYLRELSVGGAKIVKSQTYLAQVVGCSRQTVNKELGLLRDEGVIALSKGTIDVIDPDALRHRITLLDAAQTSRRN